MKAARRATGRAKRAASGGGRTRAVAREGLVGAHRNRREPVGRSLDDEPASAEPVGAGADVAPTRRAEERERTRHRLQRAEGVVPAGVDGQRQRRTPQASRQRLDAAARAADEAVTKQSQRRRA